jgi:hypothetical protein
MGLSVRSGSSYTSAAPKNEFLTYRSGRASLPIFAEKENDMRQERLTAFTETDEETFATRETTEAGDTLLDGTPKPEGVVTLYGPNNELLSAEGGEWFKEQYGLSRFRIPDAAA